LLHGRQGMGLTMANKDNGPAERERGIAIMHHAVAKGAER
jgi:hypothetical protein